LADHIQIGRERGDMQKLGAVAATILGLVSAAYTADSSAEEIMATKTAPAVATQAQQSPAEQLSVIERWYRILSQALVKYLRGRQLVPPKLLPTGAASYGFLIEGYRTTQLTDLPNWEDAI
jgi:hypothetical protein